MTSHIVHHLRNREYFLDPIGNCVWLRLDRAVHRRLLRYSINEGVRVTREETIDVSPTHVAVKLSIETMLHLTFAARGQSVEEYIKFQLMAVSGGIN